MKGVLRFVLGDQLSRGLSSLRELDAEHDVVLMVEVQEEATYVKHHKQKIAFLFSAMRHFAAELEDKGVKVDYVRLDARDNSHSFGGELARAVKRHHAPRVVVTEPGEWRVWQAMQGWSEQIGVPVDILEDDRYVCRRDEFSAWAESRSELRMEFFYREMRRKTGYLMAGDQPAGGQWNFDHDNRKRLPDEHPVPKLRRFEPDDITAEVLKLVGARFGDHFGALAPFHWGVTRTHALTALNHFVHESLPGFGDYQDAMRFGDDFLHHSVISPYLNCGLLDPREVCEKAIAAYEAGHVPLNAVEGFVRQIIGWREFVRGIYWHHMPGYARSNRLRAHRPLPWFYWSGETDMRCMADCIRSTHEHAYAHHIQRLMVTGNFALLAGIKPSEIEEWYLVVYADAYEWVELPNVHGMVMHADGGLMGSKPYAASGAYIHRMSDYCGKCVYSPTVKEGEKACPFNYLYWNFLIENEEVLSANPRMEMPYRNLARMGDGKREQVLRDARRFLSGMDKPTAKQQGLDFGD